MLNKIFIVLIIFNIGGAVVSDFVTDSKVAALVWWFSFVCNLICWGIVGYERWAKSKTRSI